MGKGALFYFLPGAEGLIDMIDFWLLEPDLEPLNNPDQWAGLWFLCGNGNSL